jgi:hypothetical protein
MMRKDNLGILEEYNENKKKDLLNYQQNLKHLIFYQTKNDLKSLINKPYLIVENSDISTEKSPNMLNYYLTLIQIYLLYLLRIL